MVESQALKVRHFNSQPHKEADIRIAILLIIREHFNSQPHKEADSCYTSHASGTYGISTHSLTRRLTLRFYR